METPNPPSVEDIYAYLAWVFQHGWSPKEAIAGVIDMVGDEKEARRLITLALEE